MLFVSDVTGISGITDIIGQSINLPEAPDLPTDTWGSILELWNFSDSAYEVTSIIQNLLGRLPPYFLAYFAISFLFLVVGLLISLINHIL